MTLNSSGRAHLLKGALAVMTAEVAHCLAESLEQKGKGGDLSQAPQTVAQLEREISRVIEELSVRTSK